MANEPGEITGLLKGPVVGADRLWELVYPELRRRARNALRGERQDHTLSATAVVNETFLRLATREAGEWNDRRHFYAVASTAMRGVLIDHARKRAAGKRGSGASRKTLEENLFPGVDGGEAGLRVAEQALDALAQKHERAALVVALRVFGGLTVPEVAKELGVSERTVKSDWTVAQVRLARILSEE